MKSQKRKRSRIILIASVILLLSSALLITSVYAAQGAEESRIVTADSETTNNAAEQPGPDSAETTAGSDIEQQKPAENLQTPVTEATIETPRPSSEAVSETPGPECITEQEATAIFSQTALDLFGLEIDEKNLTYEFNGSHETWYISESLDDGICDYMCLIDAISGEVLNLQDRSKEYAGDRITLEEFDNGAGNISAPSGGQANMTNSPDNAYIKDAAQIIKDKLADGRTIENIEIDGVQFVWDNNSEGFDPEAKGTIQVDCHVYMNTGRSYTLSFWGTNQLELRIFYSHPTQDACRWGYLFEEEASDYPNDEEWHTAEGIEAAPSSMPTPAPSPTPPPS